MLNRDVLLRLAGCLAAPVGLAIYFLATSHTVAEAGIRTMERLIIPAGMTVVALAGFAVRESRLRARRAQVAGMILGDVRLDEYTFRQFADHSLHVDQNARSGIFTMVIAHNSLEMWTSARMLAVPFGAIADIERAGAGRNGSEIEVTFRDIPQLPVLVALIGPLAGLIPPRRVLYDNAVEVLRGQLLPVDA